MKLNLYPILANTKKYLRLFNHILRPYDCMSISYFMSIVPITVLILQHCYVRDQEAEMLVRWKGLKPSSLMELDLSKNIMTYKGMESIIALIKTATNLTHFSVADSPIGDCGIQLFSHLQFKCLIQLNIENVEMGEVGVSALGDWLECNNSLQSLEISNNNINDNGLTRILNTIPSTLVRLIASDCNLTCNGAEDIGKKLKTNNTLKHLKISKNHIGDIGISVISDSLHNNKTLTQLVADSCEFHGKGARSIGKMLEANKTLKFLNISNNHIGDDGTTAIACGITTNTDTTLTKLKISGCEFHSKGTKSIADVLKRNKTLRSLNISQNYIGDDEISTLASGIQDNTTLTELFIKSKFSPKNADKLVNKNLTIHEKSHKTTEDVTDVFVTYADHFRNTWRKDAGGN